MDEAFSYCAQMVREEDRDRFLATLFAPAAVRPALHALYAFDLETARVAHRVREPLAGEVRLQWWHDVVAGLRDGEAAASPVALALRETLARYAIAPALMLGLIDSRRTQLHEPALAHRPDDERRLADTHGAILAAAVQCLDGGKEPHCRDLIASAANAVGATQAWAAARLAGAGEASEGELKAFAERHLERVRVLLHDAPPSAWPAFLPLALIRPTLARRTRAPIPAWRRQWVLWRASRDLLARL
ncbi:MAG: squalene/phytoene synthase family protein [Pseudorhodoplanes sp.]|nr:squalene/phytoene synthase family protein [Pseudorhodoplanes sp.]